MSITQLGNHASPPWTAPLLPLSPTLHVPLDLFLLTPRLLHHNSFCCYQHYPLQSSVAGYCTAVLWVNSSPNHEICALRRIVPRLDLLGLLQRNQIVVWFGGLKRKFFSFTHWQFIASTPKNKQDLACHEPPDWIYETLPHRAPKKPPWTTMSSLSSSSPRVSFESDEPLPEPKDTGTGNRRISYADEAPRRKSIQFSFGGPSTGGSSTPHHKRSLSDKGPGDKAPRRSHIEFQEKEQKAGSASRGPSPPPPK